MSLLVINSVQAQSAGSPVHYYVALNGNDKWSGTHPSPNPDKSDGPFRTLERARNAVRSLKQSGSIPLGGVTVYVREGVYFLDKPFELTQEDSGTDKACITYAAFPGETVRLVGGKPISGFTPITDKDILAQLDEKARGNVLQIDLKAIGISDYGPSNEGGAEIFFNEQPMCLSRWPNEGFVRIVDVVEQDGHEIHGIKGSKVGKFKYEGDRPSRWTKEKDPWLHGYWFWDWSDQRQPLESVDAANHILSIKPPYHNYGYRKGQWYYAFNLLSELDSPGEWFIDRERGILYFWPPQDINTAKTIMSILPSLITMKEASDITFNGFMFEVCRGTAVVVNGGGRVQLASCGIRNTGSTGASLAGKGHRVIDCEIYRTGAGGISLTGGDRTTLTPGELYAENNDIHDYGRIQRMYTPGIGVQGVGNRVAHNRIHDAPHMAIMFGGNDHLFEFNEIFNVCLESNDAGAIYAGRNWTMRGHQIRYNYLHHITGFENRGCVGVYLDDMFASATIYGNVFYKVTSAAFIGGGRDCTVENNIFVDCKPALHVDARALNWAAYHADEWIKEANEKGTLSGIAYNKPPYSTRYPQLITILNDNPKAPVGNVIARNICVGGKWDDVEKIARPFLKFEDNLLDKDPLFVDPEKGNFRLQKESPAYKLGFKEIPFDEIGIKTNHKVEAKSMQKSLTKLIQSSEFTPQDRVNAWLRGAQQYRDAGDTAQAKSCYRKALSIRPLPDTDKARILMLSGGMNMVAKNYAEARREFERVVSFKTIPAYYRSLAQLRVAKCFEREGRLDNTRKAYAKLHDIPEAPLHHAWEADEAVSILNGKREPVDTHVKLPNAPPAVVFFVALNGADTNPGTKEQPFATIQRGLDAVVGLKAKGELPKGGVRICLREGVYPIHEGLKLSDAHSGGTGAPVVIAAYENEVVRLNGGTPLHDFKPIQDNAILSRLPEESRGKVMVADLKAQGLSSFPPLAYRGFGSKFTTSVELYFDGKPMIPARWPNEGFVRTKKVLEPGSLKEQQGSLFEYDADRPARWQQARDIWMNGYWYYDWADNAIGVASIDVAKHQIRTIQTSNYGMRENQPYYVFNLLEEIDQPGEWYLDRESGRLYFYPPSDPNAAQIALTTIAEPLITINAASYVRLEGLTVEMGASDGIVARDCAYTYVTGCRIRQLAGTGVNFQGGHDCGILSSDLYALGRRGVEIIGGDRKTLTPGRHFVENCRIHDFSRIDRTYTPAVQIEGVGNRIAHNEFYDSPCHAIRLEGNDHVVEYNNIHDVVRESDDQGGIDLFLNLGYRGNILRFNYWHDIASGRACGQAGIRLDDAISGTCIYGNVFQRCSESLFGGVQIHGGKDNWVDNNVFVDCKYGISFSQWGKERWKTFLDSDSTKKLLYEDVDISKPPYTTRYPALATLQEGIDVNMVWRNIVLNCGDFMTRDNGKEITIDNLVTKQDPGFTDSTSHVFSLRDDAPVIDAIGFRPIPFGEIGLYEDPLWKSLQIRN